MWDFVWLTHKHRAKRVYFDENLIRVNFTNKVALDRKPINR